MIHKLFYTEPECSVIILWPAKLLCASENVSFETYEIVTDETFFD